MKIKNEELKYYHTLTGAKILKRLFGDLGAEYLRVWNPASRHGNRFQAIIAFKDRVDQAVQSGQLMEIGEHYHTGGFEYGVFDKNELFRWIQANQILGWLEEKGVKIDDALKEAVAEATLTTPPEPKQSKKKTKGKAEKPVGRPAPEKSAFIKEIKKRSKQIKFASDFKKPYKFAELVYSKAVVTALNPDGEYEDLTTRSDEEYEEHCNKIPRRRVQEQWLPEALQKKDV